MVNFKNDPIVTGTDETKKADVQRASSTLQRISVSGRSTHAAGVLGERASFNGVPWVTTADSHPGVTCVCDTRKGNRVYWPGRQTNSVIGFSQSDGFTGIASANDHRKVAVVYRGHSPP